MAHLYMYSCIDMILYLEYINEIVVFPWLIWLFFPLFFLSNNTSRTISLFTRLILYISWYQYILRHVVSHKPIFYSISLFFNKENTSAETATKIDFISSKWDDDHIRRLDEKNWQYFWCNQTFQGINATKALYHVLEKKGMHMKSCYVAKYKAHTKRYQELQQSWKGVLIDYSEKY